MEKLGLIGERGKGKGNAADSTAKKPKSQWSLRNEGRGSLGLSADCSKAGNSLLRFRETGVFTPVVHKGGYIKGISASIISFSSPRD